MYVSVKNICAQGVFGHLTIITSLSGRVIDRRTFWLPFYRLFQYIHAGSTHNNWPLEAKMLKLNDNIAVQGLLHINKSTNHATQNKFSLGLALSDGSRYKKTKTKLVLFLSRNHVNESWFLSFSWDTQQHLGKQWNFKWYDTAKRISLLQNLMWWN